MIRHPGLRGPSADSDIVIDKNAVIMKLFLSRGVFPIAPPMCAQFIDLQNAVIIESFIQLINERLL